MSTLRARVTAASGIFAAVFMLTTWTLLGALRPGYSSLTQFISELALGDGGVYQVVNFVVGGFCFVVFGAGVKNENARAGAAIVVAGAGLVVCGVCDSDPFPRALIPTWHGVAHDVAAAVVFVAFARALFVVDGTVARVCAVVVVVNVVIVAVGFPYAWKPTVPIATDYIGLWQRLAAMAFFVGAVDIALQQLKSAPRRSAHR